MPAALLETRSIAAIAPSVRARTSPAATSVFCDPSDDLRADCTVLRRRSSMRPSAADVCSSAAALLSVRRARSSMLRAIASEEVLICAVVSTTALTIVRSVSTAPLRSRLTSA
ncbi:hypothetical protein D9M73_223360 [compost metagenome]